MVVQCKQFRLQWALLGLRAVEVVIYVLIQEISSTSTSKWKLRMKKEILRYVNSERDDDDDDNDDLHETDCDNEHETESEKRISSYWRENVWRFRNRADSLPHRFSTKKAEHSTELRVGWRLSLSWKSIVNRFTDSRNTLLTLYYLKDTRFTK